MPTLAAPVEAAPAAQSRWIARAQDAAIFSCCANLFSTALGNVGIAVFLLLFLRVLAGSARRSLAWPTFPRSVALAIALYLGWQAIGVLYTDAPGRYAWESLWADRKILYILPLALVFGSEAARRRFLAAFLAVNGVALLLSFGLALPAVQAVFPGRQPFNVLHSHATQGMAFAMACFLSLWFVTQSGSRRGKALFLLLALGFFLNIVAVTIGRSGYVAFLVLLVAAFGWRRGARGVATGVVAALLLALVLFNVSGTVHSRVMQGVDEARNAMQAPQPSSLGIRMLLYRTTLELVARHPLLGTGTGSFKGHYSALVASRYSDWKAAPLDDPHNQYLFVLVENGLPGLAAFLFLLLALYRACDKRTACGQMAAACLLAWCATSMFSGHFRTFPEGHLIAFVLGILMPSLHAAGAHEQTGRQLQ
jgi:O-antigen ligase